MQPFDTNRALVDAVAERADGHRVLARGPGGRPVVAAAAGGDREPGIVLTAGAHATEHAGVVAAVELLDRLDTERRLTVIPTRDPLGVDGYRAALELALGDEVSFDDYNDLAALLREAADPVVDRDDAFVGLVGEFGFATARPAAGETGRSRLSAAIRGLDADDIEPLRGRRVFLVPGQPDVEGTGDFGRLYTYVVSPDGQVRHLNRFIGSAWAPAECRAVRALLESRRPGLFVDLHEYLGDGSWVSVRPSADDDVRRRALDVGRAMIDEIDAVGGRPAPLASVLAEEPDDDERVFTELETGLFDLDYRARGEGFNATDYAAEHHWLAFTNETGQYRPFEDRVETAIAAVRRAVEGFEALAE